MYNIEIDERGALFNETVKINEKDGSVDFQVPDHNNVVQSEIRYDYKMVCTCIIFLMHILKKYYIFIFIYR